MNTNFKFYVVAIALLFGLSACGGGGGGSSDSPSSSPSTPASAYTISGVLTDENGNPLENEAVTLTSQITQISAITNVASVIVSSSSSPTPSTTTTDGETDSEGRYNFSVSKEGYYTIAPKSGYYENSSQVVEIEDGTVKINNIEVTVNSNGYIEIPDFVAVASPDPADPDPAPVASTYSISGKITAHGGASLGVPISVTLTNNTTNTVTGTTYTKAGDGTFTFTSVPNGSYTVTPSKANYAFVLDDGSNEPYADTVTVEGNNVTGIDFVGSSTVHTGASVTVTVYHPAAFVGALPATFGGVTVTLKNGNGTVRDTATTTVVGQTCSCKFYNVPNGTYTVEASYAGYTFTPAVASVTVANDTALTAPRFTADH